MIRLVVIALLVIVVGIVAVQLMKSLRRAEVDWTGVATIFGFVTLAFYLRHVTGMG